MSIEINLHRYNMPEWFKNSDFGIFFHWGLYSYNRKSSPENFITAEEVINLINEIKTKKGRLLLNVGPDENGQIPDYQKKVLRRLAELQ